MLTDVLNKQLKRLHDAELLCIEDDTITSMTNLTFLLGNKKEVAKIFFKGVVSTRCMDWKFGNIVLDAYLMKKTDDESRLIDVICFTDDLNKINIEKKSYLNVLQKIKNDEYMIFELNPSYGAYCVIIAEQVEISFSPLAPIPNRGSV